MGRTGNWLGQFVSGLNDRRPWLGLVTTMWHELGVTVVGWVGQQLGGELGLVVAIMFSDAVVLLGELWVAVQALLV